MSIKNIYVMGDLNVILALLLFHSLFHRWIAIRIEFLGNLILLAAVLIAVTSDTLNGGQLGLSVTYAVQVRRQF